MLHKENRLHKREVEIVFKKGKSIKEGFLILKFIENQKKEHKRPRFSVIVPVKVSKKVSKRNRIKRQIRESLRRKINLVKRKEVDGLIIAQPQISGKTYKEIDENLEKIIKKLNNFTK